MKIFAMLLVCCLATVIPVAGMAATWHVPGDAVFIQDAINLAAAGDTVLVAAGTYNQYNITLNKALVLVSETGQADCATLDAGGASWIMRCPSAAAGTVIRGFTFVNGHTTSLYRGGALTIDVKSAGGWPLVENCNFTGNSSLHTGGGMHIAKSESAGNTCNPIISNCQFSNNSAPRGAGVMGTGPGLMTFNRCVFAGNAALTNSFDPGEGGAAFVDNGANAVFNDCDFLDNYATYTGGGVSSNEARVRFYGCLFAGNTVGGPTSGSGGALGVYDNQSLTIASCTFVANSVRVTNAIIVFVNTSVDLSKTILAFNTGGFAVYRGGAGTHGFGVSCTDVFGNEVGDWVGSLAGYDGTNGNFSEDPSFCDAGIRDFSIAESSPCAAGQHPTGDACGLIGARGIGCGPVSTRRVSWGAVKTLY